MKFKLNTAGSCYKEEEKNKLETLGFTFKKSGIRCSVDFYIKDHSDDIEIEINSLEELMDFEKEWGELVIKSNQIIIYDDYLE